MGFKQYQRNYLVKPRPEFPDLSEMRKMINEHQDRNAEAMTVQRLVREGAFAQASKESISIPSAQAKEAWTNGIMQLLRVGRSSDVVKGLEYLDLNLLKRAEVRSMALSVAQEFVVEGTHVGIENAVKIFSTFRANKTEIENLLNGLEKGRMQSKASF